MTSTPGLAAAVEAAGDYGYLASIGYGIAYPFGVVSVVLFVQLIPKILKADMAKEREALVMDANNKAKPVLDNLYSFDSGGFFAICLAAVLGFLLGKIAVTLPGGSKFSLGNSGGPLIIGLIFGHFGHLGKINISVKKPVLETLRELGLMLFLIGAGTKAGQGFVCLLYTSRCV